jgi:glycosyltransferase involved in cell wall biosynthesis
VRIGVVTSSYPPHGGSFVAAHVDAMRALGHEVDVVYIPRPSHGIPDELEQRASAFLDGARLFARLSRETLRLRHHDLIIAHWLPCALAALPARRPLIAIGHGGDVHTLRRLHLLKPTLRLLHDAKLVFVSRELRDIAGRGVVQPMGVDVARFAAIQRAPTNPPTIAVIGRLVPIKGIDVAIAALDHLRTSARLVIAGDGPLPRSSRATYLGHVDVLPLLREASVVVVPSRVLPNGRSEGTPIAALEALAAGVPVVASDVGGLRDLPVTRVPPDDPRALAAAIDHVLASPTKGPDMREYDWKCVATRILDCATV